MAVIPAVTLARAHGAFNVANGVWPLAHLRSFEAVLGPKVDRWLVYTVAGLLVCIGATQLTTDENRASVRQARSLGIGTALTLGAVDVVYVPRHRISRRYLVDAAVEAGWVLAWTLESTRGRTDEHC